MKIVVDVSPLSHPLAGVGTYIRGSLRGLVDAASGSGHDVLAFAPTSVRGPERIRAALAEIPVRTRLIPLPASHFARTAWTRLGWPPLERIVGPLDGFLHSDWMQPAQRGGVRATVIHDLVPHHHPEWCTPRTVAMHRRKDADAVARADLVFVNSRFTADDVTATLGIEPERIVVAYPGLEPGLTTALDAPLHDRSRRPVVLGFGTIEPRKNLARLVEAWRLLADEVDLTIAGGEGWGERPDLADPRITRLGYVPAAALGALYRDVSVLVYPSLYEGFGIPIVEAMACGTPVVASNHPSMDEACGDAAVRVDPHDPVDIARGIREALRRRDQLLPAGVQHASRFSWQATGEVMLAAFEERW